MIAKRSKIYKKYAKMIKGRDNRGYEF